MGNPDRSSRVIRNAERGYYQRNWKVSPDTNIHRHPLYGSIHRVQALEISRAKLVYRAISRPLHVNNIKDGWLGPRWNRLTLVKHILWRIWRATEQMEALKPCVRLSDTEAHNIRAADSEAVVDLPVLEHSYSHEVWKILVHHVTSSRHLGILGKRVLADHVITEAIITASRLGMHEEVLAIIGSLLDKEERQELFVATGAFLS